MTSWRRGLKSHHKDDIYIYTHDVNRVYWPRTCSSLERWIHGIDVKWSKQPVLPWPVGHLVSRRPTSTAAFPRLETSSRTPSTTTAKFRKHIKCKSSLQVLHFTSHRVSRRLKSQKLPDMGHSRVSWLLVSKMRLALHGKLSFPQRSFSHGALFPPKRSKYCTRVGSQSTEFDVEVLGPARDTAEYAAWHVEPYSAPCLVRWCPEGCSQLLLLICASNMI